MKIITWCYVISWFIYFRTIFLKKKWFQLLHSHRWQNRKQKTANRIKGEECLSKIPSHTLWATLVEIAAIIYFVWHLLLDTSFILDVRCNYLPMIHQLSELISCSLVRIFIDLNWTCSVVPASMITGNVTYTYFFCLKKWEKIFWF